MRIVRAAAGGAHSLALSSTGGVFSFGSGGFGALGRGTTEGEGSGDPAAGCRQQAAANRQLPGGCRAEWAHARPAAARHHSGHLLAASLSKGQPLDGAVCL